MLEVKATWDDFELCVFQPGFSVGSVLCSHTSLVPWDSWHCEAFMARRRNFPAKNKDVERHLSPVSQFYGRALFTEYSLCVCCWNGWFTTRPPHPSRQHSQAPLWGLTSSSAQTPLPLTSCAACYWTQGVCFDQLNVWRSLMMVIMFIPYSHTNRCPR